MVVKQEIKRISIGSAFKMGLMVNALLSAVFGGIAILLQAALLSSLGSFSNFTINGRSANLDVTGLTLGALCLGWIIGIGVGAIIGGIGAALAALFYNLAARFVGGLEYTTIVYRQDADPLVGQWELSGRGGY